jgi:hypothetical protein
MKRFDFASEVAKQTITIASAIITVLIAFYEKFFSGEPVVFYLVLGNLLLFAISIVLGIFSLGGIVNLVEQQEYRDASVDTSTKLKTPSAKSAFARLAGTLAARFACWQQFIFFVALLAFIFIGILDKMGTFTPLTVASPARSSTIAPTASPNVTTTPSANSGDSSKLSPGMPSNSGKSSPPVLRPQK